MAAQRNHWMNALHHMDDAADDAAIVDERLALGVGRQMRFKWPTAHR